MMFISCGLHGLYLPDPGIVLDASMPLKMMDAMTDCGIAESEPPVFISHAHADHSPSRKSASVFASPATAALLRARGHFGEITEWPFRKTLSLQNADITLYPAGHILGSSMIFIESDSGTILYTGDCRHPASSVSDGFELPDKPIDHLIIEATFALPLYRWKSEAVLYDNVRRFVLEQLNKQKTPVLFCYNLGKAQEIMHILSYCEPQVTVQVDKSAIPLCQAYESFGINLGKWEAADSTITEGKVRITPSLSGHQSLVPPSFIRTAYISGWAALGSRIKNLNADHAIALSDHLDFFELIRICQTLSPGHVHLTHTPDPGVALHFLHKAGLNASQLTPVAYNSKNVSMLTAIKRAVSHDLSANRVSQNVVSYHNSFHRPSSLTHQSAGRFHRFVQIWNVRLHDRNKDDITRTYGQYLSSIKDQESFRLAVQFLAEGPFSSMSSGHLSVSHRTLAQTACKMLDIDENEVYKPCRMASGSTSETIGTLFENLYRPSPDNALKNYSLEDIQGAFEELSNVRTTTQKSHLLEYHWQQMTPEEIRGMIRIIERGPAQLEEEALLLIPALSSAFNESEETIARTHLQSNCLSQTAVLARNKKLTSSDLAKVGYHDRSSLIATLLYVNRANGYKDSGLPEMTLGIWQDNAVSRFVAVGKTSDVSDSLDVKRLLKQIEAHANERFGPTLGLNTGIIVEVTFQGIHKHNRSRSGYKLFMPVIHCLRDDLNEHDCMRLPELAAMA